MKKRIAIVVPRFHESVAGGAEQHALLYAKYLRDEHEVSLITTTALNPRTWRNELPAGTVEHDGMEILRFRTDRERSEYWNQLHNHLLQSQIAARGRTHVSFTHRTDSSQAVWSRGACEEWLRAQGPWSSGLLAHLEESTSHYDRFVFLTYLYAPTYFGSMVTPPQKSYLVPTLHEEPAAHLACFRSMARRFRSMLWNTARERRFGARVWGDFCLKQPLTGMGIDTKQRPRGTRRSPYIFYCGRIDPGKGCAQLLDFFTQWKSSSKARDLQLVLAGTATMNIPQQDDVRFLGFVEEERKFQLMRDACAFVMPSAVESLSIVTLEALAQGVPIIANQQGAVVVDHCQKSKAGFLYADAASFAAAMETVLGLSESERHALAMNGREYVTLHYSHDSVRKRLFTALEL